MAAPLGSFDWTNERNALVAQRWADGFTATRIAEELGDGITKGAVSAKLKRLGFTKTNRTRSEKGFDGTAVQRIQAKARKPEPPEPLVAQSADAIPIAQRKQTVDLDSQHCRWPFGDPRDASFFYCGAAEADFPAVPYCRFHTKIAKGRDASAAERQQARLAARSAAQEAGTSARIF